MSEEEVTCGEGRDVGPKRQRSHPSHLTALECVTLLGRALKPQLWVFEASIKVSSLFLANASGHERVLTQRTPLWGQTAQDTRVLEHPPAVSSTHRLTGRDPHTLRLILTTVH